MKIKDVEVEYVKSVNHYLIDRIMYTGAVPVSLVYYILNTLTIKLICMGETAN